MQKTPHLLIEGIVIAAYAAGANRSFIYIRGEYELQADILDAALAEAREAGYLGERHPRLRPRALAGRAPRRRRLHLRRGDRPARLARGQARQPAPEAAVPGQPGPVPGADADQQRRDALDRAGDHRGWAASEYAKLGDRRPRPARSSYRSPGTCSGPATTRSSWASPRARSSTASPGGPPEGREVKCWFPGGSSAPVLTAEDLDVPYDFDSLAKAGSMLGSGAIIVVDDSTPIVDVGAEGRQVLPPRVLRQVHAVPRGHQLDGEDARAHRRPARRRRWTSTSWPPSRSTSSATACACSATRWRCRSAR